MKDIAVIGSGFSGIAAACFMARAGHKVTIAEKNDTIGGRARTYTANGYTFDMGPSWYWMPDVFEKFFAQFGKSPADYYNLVQLDPGFQIIFGKNDVMQVPASVEGIYDLFESIEPGSAARLRQFLTEGAFKYKVGMQQLVYKPSFSWLEFANYEVISGAARLHMFKSVSDYVRSFFKDPRLVALMEFPVLFLGAMAKQIPALYSLMNYAALQLGTWYPMGGMGELVKGMATLAESLGVDIKTNCEVSSITVAGARVTGLHTSQGLLPAQGLIASGDYHHIEQQLLDEQYRNYPATYWDKKTFAPSCLIFYVGVGKRVKGLQHHNLFFDTSLDEHAREIYEDPQWPKDPLFYVCCPSVTDPTVAPVGMENLFFLVPVATGLEDTEAIRERYFRIIVKRLEALCGDTIMEHINYKRSYCVADFKADYHAYGGNAYGLANTLRQTAVLKPSMRNKKVKNLFYAGQLTVPGPGVPPALISGQVAAEQLIKHLKTQQR